MAQEYGELVWQTAWDWVQRQYRDGFDDPAALAELTAWLKQDAAHAAAYNKACKLWLLAGLLPPGDADETNDTNEIPDTGH